MLTPERRRANDLRHRRRDLADNVFAESQGGRPGAECAEQLTSGRAG
jgi:hypothetical protein